MYTLRRVFGHDVNKELHPDDIPYDYEDEIAIPSRVKTGDIIGVTPLKKTEAILDTQYQTLKGNDNDN